MSENTNEQSGEKDPRCEGMQCHIKVCRYPSPAPDSAHVPTSVACHVLPVLTSNWPDEWHAKAAGKTCAAPADRGLWWGRFIGTSKGGEAWEGETGVGRGWCTRVVVHALLSKSYIPNALQPMVLLFYT